MFGKQIYGSSSLRDLVSFSTAASGIGNLYRSSQRIGYEFGNVASGFSQTSALNQARKSAIKQASEKPYNDAIAKFVSSLHAATFSLRDAGLKRDVASLASQLRAAALSARTLDEKQRLLTRTQVRAHALARKATGSDATFLGGIAGTMRTDNRALASGVVLRGIHRGQMEMNRWLMNAARVGGNMTRVLVPLSRTLLITNQLFRSFDAKVNQFARMQMDIAHERGGYGRSIRGAGMDFRNMMTAIVAGRKAGMSDREVIEQQLSLKKGLAQAMWGEGGLPEKLGRWGISPYKGRTMKSEHEIRIEQSRRLRQEKDKNLQLLMLQDWGIEPHQKEWLERYEEIANQQERYRKLGITGTLSNAEQLDKSGVYAKIDAETAIEDRRRKLRQQNAIDRGPREAIREGMRGEHWLFSEWTKRQRAVAEVRANVAHERFNELKKRGLDPRRHMISAELRDLSHYGEAVRRDVGEENFKKTDEYRNRQEMAKHGIKFDIDQSPIERLYTALEPVTERLADMTNTFVDKMATFLGEKGVDLVGKLEGAINRIISVLPQAEKFGEAIQNAIPAATAFINNVSDFLRHPLDSIIGVARENPAATAMTTVAAVGSGGNPLITGLGFLGGRVLDNFFSSMSGKAKGGVVPGRIGQKGDKVLIRANPGELVLNDDQQKVLDGILTARGFSNGGTVLPASERAKRLEEFFRRNRQKGSGNLVNGLSESQKEAVKSAGLGGFGKGAVHGLGSAVGGFGAGVADLFKFPGGIVDWTGKKLQKNKNSLLARTLGRGLSLIGRGVSGVGSGITSLTDAAERGMKGYADLGYEDWMTKTGDISGRNGGYLLGSIVGGKGVKAGFKGGMKLIGKGAAAIRGARALKKINDLRKNAESLEKAASVQMRNAEALKKVQSLPGGHATEGAGKTISQMETAAAENFQKAGFLRSQAAKIAKSAPNKTIKSATEPISAVKEPNGIFGRLIEAKMNVIKNTARIGAAIPITTTAAIASHRDQLYGNNGDTKLDKAADKLSKSVDKQDKVADKQMKAENTSYQTSNQENKEEERAKGTRTNTLPARRYLHEDFDDLISRYSGRDFSANEIGRRRRTHERRSGGRNRYFSGEFGYEPKGRSYTDAELKEWDDSATTAALGGISIKKKGGGILSRDEYKAKQEEKLSAMNIAKDSDAWNNILEERLAAYDDISQKKPWENGVIHRVENEEDEAGPFADNGGIKLSGKKRRLSSSSKNSVKSDRVTGAEVYYDIVNRQAKEEEDREREELEKIKANAEVTQTYGETGNKLWYEYSKARDNLRYPDESMLQAMATNVNLGEEAASSVPNAYSSLGIGNGSQETNNNIAAINVTNNFTSNGAIDANEMIAASKSSMTDSTEQLCDALNIVSNSGIKG